MIDDSSLFLVAFTLTFVGGLWIFEECRKQEQRDRAALRNQKPTPARITFDPSTWTGRKP